MNNNNNIEIVETVSMNFTQIELTSFMYVLSDVGNKGMLSNIQRKTFGSSKYPNEYRAKDYKYTEWYADVDTGYEVKLKNVLIAYGIYDDDYDNKIDTVQPLKIYIRNTLKKLLLRPE